MRTFLAFLILSSAAFGQGVSFQTPPIMSQVPQPIAGLNGAVCLATSTGTPCTPTVSVFSDSALSVPITNLKTDGDGLFPTFFISPGQYQWCASDTLGRISAYCTKFTAPAAAGSSPSFVNLTVTGNETVGGTLGVTTLLSESNVFYCEGQAGADIGAKCNAAYTAGNCATQYCTIRLWKPGPGTKTITITLGNTFTIPVWTYSTTIAFPTPVRFECAGGVWLDYSGSGQAINQGASGATINNRNPLPFIIDGCGFTGGASMSAGIYHNSFVIKSFVKNVNMIGFGNTTAYNIDFQSDNWYSHIQNVWMWSESTNPTCFNGIRINDSSTVPVYDNGDSFVRFLGVHIQNLSGTACTTTVAVNVNSFQPDFQQVDLLGGFHTLVRLRKGANHASFTHFYGETVNSEAGVCGILYGDLGTDPNPAVSNYIDALNAGPDFFINVHNTDLTTTAHAFCPATGTTGTQDWNLNNVVIAQLTAGQPVVVQNNNASQSGNSATGTRVTTGATPLAPGTGVGTSLHTAGGSITRWAGADEDLTSYGNVVATSGVGNFGSGTVAAPAVTAGSTGIGFWNNGGHLEYAQGGASLVGFFASLFQLKSTGGLVWGSGAVNTASDTGISRGAANVVDVGNGTVGDVSGEIRSAKISATYNAAGTVQTAVHIVQDSGALSSGTPSTATITLAGAAVFTSNTTYNCSATNKTTQANNLKISYTDGSHFVVTGPNTVTDSFSFVCVGN